MIGRGTLTCNLYILDTTVDLATINLCGTLQGDEHLWHQRLGHPSLNKLQHIPCISSVSKSSPTSIVQCPVCPLAKQKRLPYVSHNHLSDNPFDIVHLDIWGPFSIESIEGYRYFLTIVDDCNRVTWIYILRNKSDVSTIFPLFLTHVKTQYNSSIKCILYDSAPELAFPHLIKEHGIVHQFSCAYTPQHNSVVEHKHQHILIVARTLMFQSNIPNSYWSDCVSAEVFFINRTPFYF